MLLTLFNLHSAQQPWPLAGELTHSSTITMKWRDIHRMNSNVSVHCLVPILHLSTSGKLADFSSSSVFFSHVESSTFVCIVLIRTTVSPSLRFSRNTTPLFSSLFRGSYQMLSGFLHPGSNLLHKYQHFAFFYTSTKYTLQSGAIANLIVLYKVIHFLKLFTEGNGYELVTKEVTSQCFEF